MALSAIDVIGPAFDHMKKQLFSPFRFGQWVRLAVVGLLAGEMGASGGFSGPPPGLGSPSSSPQVPAQGPLGSAAPLFIVGIVILVLLSVVLGIALLYVHSRMRFVLFDSVLTRECHVRQSWARRGPEAFRYFTFQLLFLLCITVAMGVLIGIPLLAAFAAGWLQNPRDHVLPLVLGGVGLLAVFFAAMVTIGIVYVLIKDFVIPQMALEGLTVGEGWRRTRAMITEEKGGFAGYIGMKIVLAIAAGIAIGIISLIVLLLLLIPVGGIGIIAVLGGKAAGISWNPVTIAIAIVCGIIVLCGVLFVMALLSVPAIVFFPAYSMHFFAERYLPLKTALEGGLES